MPLVSDSECGENIPLAFGKTATTHFHKSCYTVFVFQTHRYKLRTTLLFLLVIALWDSASSRCLFFAQGSRSCCQSDIMPTVKSVVYNQTELTTHDQTCHWTTPPPHPKKQNLSLFCVLQYSLLPVNGDFPLKYRKTVFDFCLLWRTDSADRGVWMNIRCRSTTQTGKTMCGPPEDAGKGIVRIKGKHGTQQNEGSQGLWPH